MQAREKKHHTQLPQLKEKKPARIYLPREVFHSFSLLTKSSMKSVKVVIKEEEQGSTCASKGKKHHTQLPQLKEKKPGRIYLPKEVFHSFSLLTKSSTKFAKVSHFA